MNPANDHQDYLKRLTWLAVRQEDLPEYDRIKHNLIKVLDRLGGFEPEVDELYIDQIARTAIYARKLEAFLDSDSATVHTYSKAADTKLKLWKAIETALRELALARRDRLTKQTQADLTKQLREAMLRGLDNAAK